MTIDGLTEFEWHSVLFLCVCVVIFFGVISVILYCNLRQVITKPLMTMDEFIVLRSSLMSKHNSQQSATVINWDVKK
ncbi:hypothetical protein [uncultured Tolumonas sp.]|uniref:hypothetical protein n=1 Tax=uncultured Tolumonas sp. TaxID=263765 RepID=UPI002A0A6B33|nr:hypothetical protein [uncultured Tolumonas sp.]